MQQPDAANWQQPPPQQQQPPWTGQQPWQVPPQQQQQQQQPGTHWPQGPQVQPPFMPMQQQQQQHSSELQAVLSQLGCDQQTAVNAVLKGQSVFLTGGAGVGKSFTVDALVQLLRGSRRAVAVTASTGTAALNINGMTVHSWAGIIDIHKHPVELAETLWGWEQWNVAWDNADVLVLDEISMVDCDLLEAIDYLARYMRGWRIWGHSLFDGHLVHELHPLPFGGMQVVAVGDFFQLPPVSKKNTWEEDPVRVEQAKRAKEQLPPGTVKQGVPVVMALLPPEAVEAHVEARTAAAAGNTEAAYDQEYQRYYRSRPMRGGLPQQQQQQQYNQQVQAQQYNHHPHQQQHGGDVFAAPWGAGAAGSCLPPLCGLMQPQTAAQLLTPPAPCAAGHLAGGLAQGQRPVVKQEGLQSPQQHQHQQQQQQQPIKQEWQGLQSPPPPQQQQQQAIKQEAQQQQQQQWEELSSPLLPTQKLVSAEGLDDSQPALKRRRTGGTGDEGQQLPGCAAGEGEEALSASVDGSNGGAAASPRHRMAAVAVAAAVAAEGSDTPAAAVASAEDLSYEAISAAIQQAESQSRPQQPPASQLQQQQQQQASPWLSPQQQRQRLLHYGTPSRGEDPHRDSPSEGTPSRGPASVARSALSALHLAPQPPLPFSDNFDMQQHQQHQQQQQLAAPVETSAVEAGMPSAACEPPCTQWEVGLAVGGALRTRLGFGFAGAAAAAGAAAVVAAAAVPLPPDSPAPHAQFSPGQARLCSRAAHAAAAALGSPDVVVLGSQDPAAAAGAAAAAGGGVAKPGLYLNLASPASSQGAVPFGGAASGSGAAGVAGAGVEESSDVIEILDSDSPFPSPIDLTVSPVGKAGPAAPQPCRQRGPAGAAGAALPHSLQEQPGWLCAALFPQDGPGVAAAVPQPPAPNAVLQRPQQHQEQTPQHLPQQQQQVWPPQHQQQQAGPHLQQQYQQQQYQQAWPPQQHPGAAAGAASAADGSSKHSDRFSGLLQQLQQAANLPLTPPASPTRPILEDAATSAQGTAGAAAAGSSAGAAAAAAAGAAGAAGGQSDWCRETRQRPARNVCGCLLSKGLVRSRLFEAKEMKLGHVYGRCNGRAAVAWRHLGYSIHPDLHKDRPQGFDWSPTGPMRDAAAATVATAAGGGARSGGGGSSGAPGRGGAAAAAGQPGGSGGSSNGSGGGSVRQPLLLSSGSPATGPRGAPSGNPSGGSGPGGRPWVPRLPVQFLKQLPAPGEYCFKSPAWAATKFKPVILRDPYRQSDPELLTALNDMRLGRMTKHTRWLLSECKRPLPDDGINATNLFPHKKDADRLNRVEYDALAGPEFKYGAMDSCTPDVYNRARTAEKLDENTNCCRVLSLKPLTQVLLVYNIDVPGGLANGTRGVVEGFVSIRDYLKQERVRFAGQPYGSSKQGGATHAARQPGREAHSCGTDGLQQQQQRLQQQQQVNLAPAPEQCHVSLCPCHHKPWSQLHVNQQTQAVTVLVQLADADTLELLELPSQARQRDKLQQAIKWLNHSRITTLPLCRFTVSKQRGGIDAAAGGSWGGDLGGAASSGNGAPGGMAYKWLVVGPQDYRYRTNTRVHFGVQLSRMQLPLLHAWAITVHKSQGMSISKLVVNIQRAFAAGMVYVALSRCTSRDGLQVVGDVPAPVSDSDVKSFYEWLFSIEHSDS